MIGNVLKTVGSGLQKVSNVVKQMGRNPEVRKKSRQAQNERRKIERRMARIISSQTGQKVSGKQAIEMYESGIGDSRELKELYRTRESLISKPKKGTKQRIGYDVDVEKVAKRVESFTQIYFGQETLAKKGNVTLERRNKLFERQINQSTMKNGLSALSRDETKAFYASTLDIWNGLSNADNRNAQIMLQFGVSDLSQVYKLLTDKELIPEDFGFADREAFDDWIAELNERVQLSKRREIVQDELRSIRGSRISGGTTDDESYNQSDEKTPETSPEYINRIISRISMALNNV